MKKILLGKIDRTLIRTNELLKSGSGYEIVLELCKLELENCRKRLEHHSQTETILLNEQLAAWLQLVFPAYAKRLREIQAEINYMTANSPGADAQIQLASGTDCEHTHGTATLPGHR